MVKVIHLHQEDLAAIPYVAHRGRCGVR